MGHSARAPTSLSDHQVSTMATVAGICREARARAAIVAPLTYQALGRTVEQRHIVAVAWQTANGDQCHSLFEFNQASWSMGKVAVILSVAFVFGTRPLTSEGDMSFVIQQANARWNGNPIVRTDVHSIREDRVTLPCMCNFASSTESSDGDTSDTSTDGASDSSDDSETDSSEGRESMTGSDQLPAQRQPAHNDTFACCLSSRRVAETWIRRLLLSALLFILVLSRLQTDALWMYWWWKQTRGGTTERPSLPDLLRAS